MSLIEHSESAIHPDHAVASVCYIYFINWLHWGEKTNTEIFRKKKTAGGPPTFSVAHALIRELLSLLQSGCFSLTLLFSCFKNICCTKAVGDCNRGNTMLLTLSSPCYKSKLCFSPKWRAQCVTEFQTPFCVLMPANWKKSDYSGWPQVFSPNQWLIGFKKKKSSECCSNNRGNIHHYGDKVFTQTLLWNCYSDSWIWNSWSCLCGLLHFPRVSSWFSGFFSPSVGNTKLHLSVNMCVPGVFPPHAQCFLE